MSGGVVGDGSPTDPTDYGWTPVSGWQFYRWGFFFRIRGWGAAIQRDLPILFSERNGYRKRLRFGRWAFSFLRPERVRRG